MGDTEQADQVSNLAQEINVLAQSLKDSGNLKPGETRVNLQEAVRKLNAALESPPEAIFRHAFEVMQRFCCLTGVLITCIS